MYFLVSGILGSIMADIEFREDNACRSRLKTVMWLIFTPLNAIIYYAVRDISELLAYIAVTVVSVLMISVYLKTAQNKTKIAVAVILGQIIPTVGVLFEGDDFIINYITLPFILHYGKYMGIYFVCGILGTVIADIVFCEEDISERREKMLKWLIFAPVTFFLYLFFMININKLFGFFVIAVIFVLIFLYYIRREKRKIKISIAVIPGQIIPVVCLILILVEICFSYGEIGFTEFTREETQSVLNEYHIKDNGDFTIENAVRDNYDGYCIVINADVSPETFVNELMDKEYYDTEAIEKKINEDEEDHIVLEDYAKEETEWDIRDTFIYFDKNENKCSIYTESFHGNMTDAIDDIIENRTDTIFKKLKIYVES